MNWQGETDSQLQYVVYVHLITNQIELILLCFLNYNSVGLKCVEYIYNYYKNNQG